MTSSEFFSQLNCAAEHLPYVAITESGEKLFRALLAGQEVNHFFAVIERVFQEGDEETQNLCVVGLFEYLQNKNYREGDPDLVERHLGPLSLCAWSKLIEGWTGPGVRTIAQWRRE